MFYPVTDPKKWLEWLPRPRKHHHIFSGSLETKNLSEPLFSLGDVTIILKSALTEQEEELKKEYDRNLSQKLSEQAMAYEKYQEEHIDGKLRKSSFNYFS